jgi:hypothetical protein
MDHQKLQTPFAAALEVARNGAIVTGDGTHATAFRRRCLDHTVIHAVRKMHVKFDPNARHDIMHTCVDRVPLKVFKLAARYVVIMHKSSLDALELALDELHHDDEELVLDDLMPRLKEAIDQISMTGTEAKKDAEAAALKAATRKYDTIVRGMQLPKPKIDSAGWSTSTSVTPAEVSAWERTLDTLDMLEQRLQSH